MAKTHLRLAHGKTLCGRTIPPFFTRYGYRNHVVITFDKHKVSCLRCLKTMIRKTKRLTEIELVHLHVNTLRGASLGAIHWYAEIQTEDDDKDLKIIELSHPLSPAEAAELNKSDEYTTIRDFAAGELYSGFWTRQKAVKAGLKQWRNLCPGGVFLVLGQHMYEQPKIIIDTIFKDDEGLKAAAAEIVEMCENIGWFDNPNNDDLMDEYCLQWQVLLGERMNL